MSSGRSGRSIRYLLRIVGHKECIIWGKISQHSEEGGQKKVGKIGPPKVGPLTAPQPIIMTEEGRRCVRLVEDESMITERGSTDHHAHRRGKKGNDKQGRGFFPSRKKKKVMCPHSLSFLSVVATPTGYPFVPFPSERRK